jgi:hypothetical protein
MHRNSKRRLAPVSALLLAFGFFVLAFAWSGQALAQDEGIIRGTSPTFTAFTLPSQDKIRIRACEINIAGPLMPGLAAPEARSQLTVEEYDRKIYVRETPKEVVEKIESGTHCNSTGFSIVTLPNGLSTYVRSCSVNMIGPVAEGTADKRARTSITVHGVIVLIRETQSEVQKLLEKDGHCGE